MTRIRFSAAAGLLVLFALPTLAARPAPIEVPATMLGRYFVVQGSLNGKPARLIVDSGAGQCVLNPEAAKRFGVPEGQRVLAGGAGEKPVEARMTTAASLKLGAAEAKNVGIVVLQLPKALDCDGLVGYTFLRNFAVQFDYQKPAMTLFAPGGFKPAAGSTTVPMKLRHNIPIVPGTLDGIEGWYSLDTGANGSLTVMSPFVAQHRLVEKYPLRLARIVGKGVGGYVQGESVVLQRVGIGGVELERVPGSFSTAKSGALAAPDLIGNIGGDVLSRFVTTLDYAAGKATFSKSPAFGRSYDVDRAGIFVEFDSGAPILAEVVPGGPASEAGLMAGDELISVGGVPVSSIPMLELSRRFRAGPGAKIAVAYRRGGSRAEATIVLRDLLSGD